MNTSPVPFSNADIESNDQTTALLVSCPDRCHSGFGPAADRVRVGHDLLAETVRYREERPGSALELIA